MKERNVPGVGSKLKELRISLDKNQKEFAAMLGVRQSTLSSYENDVSFRRSMSCTISRRNLAFH